MGSRCAHFLSGCSFSASCAERSGESVELAETVQSSVSGRGGVARALSPCGRPFSRRRRRSPSAPRGPCSSPSPPHGPSAQSPPARIHPRIRTRAASPRQPGVRGQGGRRRTCSSVYSRLAGAGAGAGDAAGRMGLPAVLDESLPCFQQRRLRLEHEKPAPEGVAPHRLRLHLQHLRLGLPPSTHAGSARVRTRGAGPSLALSASVISYIRVEADRLLQEPERLVPVALRHRPLRRIDALLAGVLVHGRVCPLR